MKFKIYNDYNSVQDYLATFLRLSKKNIHNVRMESHHNETCVVVNGKPATLNSALANGDILKINIKLATSNYLKNSDVKINIDYEDDYLLIASKPFGIKTHPNDVAGENNTLVNYLIADYDYLEPIHRLDTDTCGLVIFAKTPFIKAKLDLELEARAIKRYYTALVKNNIKEQTITTKIGRDSREKNKMAVTNSGKTATTNILSCTKLSQNIFATNISLETGRTHQIRVHLAYLRVPIIGDKLYSNDGYKYKNMYLGALKVEFTHPVTNKKIEVESSLKDEFFKNIE